MINRLTSSCVGLTNPITYVLSTCGNWIETKLSNGVTYLAGGVCDICILVIGVGILAWIVDPSGTSLHHKKYIFWGVTIDLVARLISWLA